MAATTPPMLGGAEVPKTCLLELVGDEVEHTLAVALRGEAAVAVAAADLLELVVQVAHGCCWRSPLSGRSVAPGGRLGSLSLV